MKKIFKQNGFSLLEIVAAVFVITLALVGVSSLAVSNIRTHYDNRASAISAMLVQEGLELARNQRDSDWFNNNNFGTVFPEKFSIDYTGTIRTAADISADNAKLKFDAGFYHHGTGTATPFSRIIQVVSSDDDKIELKCLVRYQRNGQNYDYEASTILYDWY